MIERFLDFAMTMNPFVIFVGALLIGIGVTFGVLNIRNGGSNKNLALVCCAVSFAIGLYTLCSALDTKIVSFTNFSQVEKGWYVPELGKIVDNDEVQFEQGCGKPILWYARRPYAPKGWIITNHLPTTLVGW